MRNILRELELELSYYLDMQRGPQAWREAWLRVIDGIAEPFEEHARKTWPSQPPGAAPPP